MFVDIHVIQNVPPSNINRDDTGTPKTAVFGGALRARVSSQAWKHAMRKSFMQYVPADELGCRTAHACELIAVRIVALDPGLAEVADAWAQAVLNAAGVKTEKSKRKGKEMGTQVTQYLIFIAERELDKLAALAVRHARAGEDASKPPKELKKEVSKAFHGRQALDIALFGRMLADAPDLSTDASAQVAHAISVDKITQEYDYFTALDDCSASDNAGASMIESVGFNSSTLYRYATVNVDSLREQLGDDQATVVGVEAFVKAFVRSMPTGKQNTFANRTVPSTVIVALRSDQPINASAAFEKPVRAQEGASISERAEERLVERLINTERMYGSKARRTWISSIDGQSPKLDELGVVEELPQIFEDVKAAVLAELKGDEQ
ncbi:type I-E CRISPR-associated protein Cas7/Cse4/CasC [Olsenella sp. HMSC062G07]|uniref:type I-E CRISPR-associated protein Cas7/Cse4/CasC n=1 Tax=Olsenella sp. HMSC062G07 TaxID=1739330 RepID=UPI0008A3D3BB|nr:type I-E CRISPR-associated protein Cas7/Cse4/CasC [Olsenella sp. HMSC062G07]OFK22310.1 type I-E CRISPR-associated protein Cas7/Cse4/CasC [Olsenella sp. HMSC062G07]